MWVPTLTASHRDFYEGNFPRSLQVVQSTTSRSCCWQCSWLQCGPFLAPFNGHLIPFGFRWTSERRPNCPDSIATAVTVTIKWTCYSRCCLPLRQLSGLCTSGPVSRCLRWRSAWARRKHSCMLTHSTRSLSRGTPSRKARHHSNFPRATHPRRGLSLGSWESPWDWAEQTSWSIKQMDFRSLQGSLWVGRGTRKTWIDTCCRAFCGYLRRLSQFSWNVAGISQKALWLDFGWWKSMIRCRQSATFASLECT